MNERIKELAKQVYGSQATEQEIKLAELIVWDCMLICEDVMKKDNSALGCWSEIKRTFRS
jgi:hypothetical protein